MVRLTREQARRIAVRAQLLAARVEALSVAEVVDEIGVAQIDPTSAIAPSVDLVLWSRLGAAYEHSDLTHALETERSLVEFGSYVRPMDDVGLVIATVDGYDAPRARAWVAANDSFRRDLLERLDAEGPLTSTEIPDTATVPWESSGWTHDRNVVRMLDLLIRYGEVAVSGRRTVKGRRVRTYDLAERVYPADLEVPPPDEAQRMLDERRLASLGIALGSGRQDQLTVGTAGLACTVDGVEGEWRVDADAFAYVGEHDPEQPRAALLSPFDRLVCDRSRTLALFDFEYVLEMYKPAAQRRWGYFALPILYGDRLVGKLDAKADRKTRVLTVHAVHPDGAWDAEVGDAVEAEIEALATWLGLEVTHA